MRLSKLIFLSVIFIFYIFSSPVLAATLVNTTFEPDAPVAGDWQIGDWGLNPDIASGVDWTGTSGKALVSSYEPYAGSQCGKVAGTTSYKVAALIFGSGNNTGVYTLTYYAKHSHGSAGTNVATTWIRNAAGTTAVQLDMVYYSDGTPIIRVKDNTGYVPLIKFTDKTWYQFQVTLDINTQKYNVRVRQAGASLWAATRTDRGFVSSINSFDQIKCGQNQNGDSGYWDNITVVEGNPAEPYQAPVEPNDVAGDLVYTTFEPDLPSSGDWILDDFHSEWGGEPDIANPNNVWVNPYEFSTAQISDYSPQQGLQCGKIKSSSSAGSVKQAYLDFGDGNNTGKYTLSFFGRHSAPDTAFGDYTRTIIRDSSGRTITEISQKYDASDPCDVSRTIEVKTAAGWVVLQSSFTDKLWYEFRIVFDFTTKTFDAAVKQAGYLTWQAEATDQVFCDPGASSLDCLKCCMHNLTADSSSSAYWDAIRIFVPGCGDYGYFPADLNKDCYVDMKDVSFFVLSWLDCTDPDGLECLY